MEALRVEGLSKTFGGVQALCEVSFDLKAGEKLAIIGLNGAGKTTLLNVINGQLLPTAGRIFFFGQEITTRSTPQRSRLGMARSFQLITLLPGLTVLENILFALGDNKTSHFKMFRPMTAYKHLFTKAEEFLREVALWEKRDDLVRNIGYGEQRRLEITLCLASQPRLLLLDEPNCGLTSAENAELVQKIGELAPDIPVIIVSHDMDLVFDVAERIIVLHYGRIIADGKREKIRTDSRVAEIYMGMEKGQEIAEAT